MNKPSRNSRKPAPLLRQTCARYFELRQATWQPNTLRARRYAVLRFIAMMQKRYPHVRRFSNIRRHPHIEDWLRSIRHLHPLTRHTYILILNQFFRDLIDWQWPEAPPRFLIQETDLPPCSKQAPKPFDSLSDQLLQNAFEQHPCVMNLGLSVLRATGLRVSELLALPLDAMCYTREGLPELKVPPGKTYTERTLPLTARTAALIDAIRQLRGRNVPEQLLPPLLMVNENGRPLRYHNYRRHLKRLARLAALPHWQQANLHRLRHTFATELARAQVPLPSLMRLLGHRRPDMTMRYVQLTAQDIRQNYEKALANLRGSHSPACILSPAATFDDTPVLSDFRTLIARIDHQRRDALSAPRRDALARLVKRLRAALRTFQNST